jgi:hypothetical protein
MDKEIFFDVKGQIWVETAIYTLIGLIIIGFVIAIVTPAIDRYKDSILLEQTITVLNDLDNKIIETRDSGAGNKRIAELRIKKGMLDIDCPGDKIVYVLEESGLEYSQVGEEVIQGDITIKTEKRGRKYDITLSLSYEDVDLKYNGNEEKKTLHPVATLYKLSIENEGVDGGKVRINFKGIS